MNTVPQAHPGPAFLARSYLYVPGDSGTKMSKAARSGADALILDLEDGVSPTQKEQATRSVSTFLSTQPGLQCWVRIDPPLWRRHLPEIVGAGLHGLFVPKAENRADLESIGTQLDLLELEQGLEPHSIQLVPIIESAAGLGALHELAAAPRVVRLGMGESDLRAALHLRASSRGYELLFARSSVVIASAQAQLASPVASTSTDFRDLAALEHSSSHLRDLGFTARTAIHPDQIPVINAAFAPTDTEIEQAQAIVAAFEAGEANHAAVLAIDGTLIDLAVVRIAQQVIDAGRRDRRQR